MTIPNHLLVGAGIATVVTNPFLALPLAFLSHFVLDALPHFGYNKQGYGELFKHKRFYAVQVISVFGVLALPFAIDINALTVAAAIVALSPDFEWPYRYFFFERKNRKPPSSPIQKFHTNIQWCERSWGIYVEVVFYILIFTVLRTV